MAVRQEQVTLSEAQLRFLAENPFVGVLTTLRRDGSPHSTVVWVDVQDGVVSFNTEEGRAKVRHVDDDPRVALLVLDPSDPYKWVSITGTTDITTEGATRADRQAGEEVPRRGRVPVGEPRQAAAQGADRADARRLVRLRLGLLQVA
jgi:PPOX class probable F420-dependent enzyme